MSNGNCSFSKTKTGDKNHLLPKLFEQDSAENKNQLLQSNKSVKITIVFAGDFQSCLVDEFRHYHLEKNSQCPLISIMKFQNLGMIFHY